MKEGQGKGPVLFLLSVSLVVGVINGHTGAVDKMDTEYAAHRDILEMKARKFSFVVRKVNQLVFEIPHPTHTSLTILGGVGV
jgi:hypothetical protein